jgi:opacity protein-like surface antigen
VLDSFEGALLKVRLTAIFAVVILSSALAAGQSFEVAGLVGGHIPISPSVNVSTGFAVQGNLAGRIAGVPMVGVYVEVPVIATWGIDAGTSCVTDAVCKFSSLWVTPGLKLKIGSALPVSPYFLAGGGVVRFKTTQSDNSTNSETHPVFDIGGGLDVKIAPYVSLRGELRDMYSGSPRLTIESITGHQHNLMLSAGVVFRF